MSVCFFGKRDLRGVPTRLLWIRRTLGYEKWVFIGAYGSEQERNDLWEELSV